MKIKQRLTHPATWTAIVGLIMLFVNRFIPVETEFIESVLTAIGLLLVALGVYADPTSEGILDKDDK